MIRALILRHYRRFAPVLDLGAQAFRGAVLSYDAFDAANLETRDAVAAELSAVLGARGTFELWSYSARFEARFAAWCGRRFGVGLASGTAAIQLALTAAGIGAGDEVITSAHTFVATILAIRNTGATPILVDPDPTDLCLRADAVARAITPRTRAVVPVHMHGHVADMDGILALDPRLVVIEDCAQAHGATLRGRRVPIGPTGCFSFYASKPLGGAGNGGMVVTDDEGLARRIQSLRDPEGDTPGPRTPSYLDALEAALLTARLPKMEDWRARRAANAAAYAALPVDQLRPAPGVGSAWYSFVIRHPTRDALKRDLLLRGIETKIEYHPGLLRQLGIDGRPFPVAMAAADQGLALPVHPFLSADDRARVIAQLMRIL